MFGLGLGSRAGPAVLGPFVPTSTQSAAWLARVTGLSSTDEARYDALITGLVNDGVWAKLDVLSLYAAPTAAIAVLNLISTSYTATPENSPAFAADGGYTGTAGGSTYIATNYIRTAGGLHYTEDSATLFVWTNTAVGGSDQGQLIPFSAGDVELQNQEGATLYTIAQGSTENSNGGVFTTGLVGWSRTGASANAVYVNGSAVKSWTDTAASVTANPVTVGGSGGTSGTAAQIAAFGAGAGLTATDWTNLYSRLYNFFYSTIGIVPTFEDDFTSLSLWNGSSGTWETCPYYSASNGNNVTGELGWMLNSNYGPTSSVQSWTVSNGILSLIADKAPVGIQPDISSFQYTSPWLDSYHSFSQAYGYFEMRAQLPKGQGLHPGFWLLNFPPQTPYCELDIEETIGSQTSQLVTTVWSGPQQSSAVSVGQSNNTIDTSAAFHVYGVLWTPTTITWFLDGAQVFETATPADMAEGLPMYIIINDAVGGSWPGPPDGTTPWPAVMQVDYVKVYSLNDGRRLLGM